MTAFDCNDIRKSLSVCSLVMECDVIDNGTLRLATPFRYPDGSQIDLFLGPAKCVLPSLPQIILTDLGQTTANLLDLHIKPWSTKKRKQVVSDICRSLGVEHLGGEFRLTLENINGLPEAIVRLSQACIRISDRIFAQRFVAPTALREDLEEFLSAIDLPYDAGIKLPGRHGNEIVVDFRVKGHKLDSLILSLSTANTASANPLAKDAFIRWNDLSHLRPRYQFISIYDSRNDVFRSEDISRLGEASSVFGFPAEQDSIQTALAA